MFTWLKSKDWKKQWYLLKTNKTKRFNKINHWKDHSKQHWIRPGRENPFMFKTNKWNNILTKCKFILTQWKVKIGNWLIKSSQVKQSQSEMKCFWPKTRIWKQQLLTSNCTFMRRNNKMLDWSTKFEYWVKEINKPTNIVGKLQAWKEKCHCLKSKWEKVMDMWEKIMRSEYCWPHLRKNWCKLSKKRDLFWTNWGQLVQDWTNVRVSQMKPMS